jgi:hypothetical protein
MCVIVCAQFVCLCHPKGVLIFGVSVSESVRAQCVCVAGAAYHLTKQHYLEIKASFGDDFLWRWLPLDDTKTD